MTIQQAIKKAIEGGWNHKDEWFPEYESDSFLLLPSFWRALGKAMGWNREYILNWREYKKAINQFEPDNLKTDISEWLYHWHRLIDHLAEGKDIESFFETLL